MLAFAISTLGFSLQSCGTEVAEALATERDALVAFNTTATVPDNRIGFCFATLCLGSEDGHDSTIAGSRARIIAVAKTLHNHPNTRVIIEGHVGVSAPPELAQAYSEYRAQIIAQILEEDFQICPHRITTRGWSYHVSRAAQTSAHPNAQTAKEGFGWAEVFITSSACEHALTFPERPDYCSPAAARTPRSPPALE